MGPIEHAVCQIAFKIDKKYQDNEFKDQVLSIASSIASVEITRRLGNKQRLEKNRENSKRD